MLLQSQGTRHFANAASWVTPSKTTTKSNGIAKTQLQLCKLLSFKSPKCSLSMVSEAEATPLELGSKKPFPAEVSRTIMELATVGTLSTVTQEGCPLGIGVRFAVDTQGTPLFCLNASNNKIPFSLHAPSSLHVQLNQSGLRSPQCTLQGTLTKPQDNNAIKPLITFWRKKFGEEVDQDFIYIVDIDRVLQLEDLQEDGVWVESLDYKNAQPDPLRESAEKLVSDINTNNMEDITRFCNVYVDLDFQVSEAKMIWVDRLGFDMRLFSPQKGRFEVRIPFPREVTDEKGAKSTFNCMSQLAWEVEKNFHLPDFEKVKQLKHIKS